MDEKPSEQTLCVIHCYQAPSETDSNLDFKDLFHISLTSSKQDPSIFSSQIHCPHFPVKIFTSKFAKLITAIVVINIGASSSILYTKFLPKEYWLYSIFQFYLQRHFFYECKNYPSNCSIFPSRFHNHKNF